MSLPISLPQELCGEDALKILPETGGPRGEVIIFGEGVARIDAWGGAALRTAIEYHGRYLQRRVTLSLPHDQGACALLHGLVRHDHPRHLVLPNDSNSQGKPVPRNVLLQAQPIATADDAERVAEMLFNETDGRLREAARFAAKSLPELIVNSLIHGKRRPIPPVACAIHDREEDEVQLVVTDLGRPRPPYDSARLSDAVLSSPGIHGLSSMVEQAERRSLDLSLSLVAGSGRLAWRSGNWHAAEDEPLSGFSAAIAIPV